MIIPVYCIKDDLLGFQNPFCSMNDATATRDFELVVTKPETVFNAHKENFNLYKIGDFDSESGLIDPKVEFIQAATVYERKKKGK